jgi:hypothetical protein
MGRRSTSRQSSMGRGSNGCFEALLTKDKRTVAARTARSIFGLGRGVAAAPRTRIAGRGLARCAVDRLGAAAPGWARRGGETNVGVPSVPYRELTGDEM